MIDTDKYEGHTEGKREIQHNAFIHIEERGLYATIAGGFTTADVELIADAPLLLAEVKRLREENHNRWVVIGKLRRQIKGLQDDLEDWMAGEYHAGSD